MIPLLLSAFNISLHRYLLGTPASVLSGMPGTEEAWEIPRLCLETSLSRREGSIQGDPLTKFLRQSLLGLWTATIFAFS